MKLATRVPFFYGWVIVASSFVVLGLSYTVWYSFSVFFVALLEAFGWSRAVTAGAFSVFVLVHGLAGPVAGSRVDRNGPRVVVVIGAVILAAGLVIASGMSEPWQLYLGYGVLAAAGVNSTGWVSNVTMLQNWFRRNMGLALGIASAGTGAGIVFLVPLTQVLVLGVGWRATYLWMAAAVLVVMIPTTLLFQRRHPAELGLLADGEPAGQKIRRPEQDHLVVNHAWVAREWSLPDAVRTKAFWFTFTCGAMLTLANQMALVHQVALLVDAGYDKLLAASAIGLVGMASVGAKLSWGWIADRIGREVAFSIGVGIVMVAVTALTVARHSQLIWLPYLYGLLMGIGYSVTPVAIPTLTADLFRGRHFGAIFGVMSLGNCLGGAFGSLAAGYVFDVTGDYLPALLLAEGALLVGVACLWLAAPRKVRLAPGRAPRRIETSAAG